MDSDCDWEDVSEFDGAKGDRRHSMGDSITTLILVGKTGSGKSATGNAILGSKEFLSRKSPSSVTTTCSIGKVQTSDGRSVHVIDTPGMFDTSLDSKSIREEFSNCMEFAVHGLHGILLVLSAGSRFTEEEHAAVKAFETIFGHNVLNYAIIIFTGGDDLEEESQTLDDYLAQSPPPLKDLISRCGGRVVLFDNRNKSTTKMDKQRNDLLAMVDKMVIANGIRYTTENFEVAKETQKSQESIQARVAQLEKQLPQMVMELTAERKQTEQELVKLRQMLEESNYNAEVTKADLEERLRLADAERIQLAARAEDIDRQRKAFEEERRRYEEGQWYNVVGDFLRRLFSGKMYKH